MTDTLLTEVQEGVLILTINRPNARNAIDPATAHALADTLDAFEDDDDLLVGILTGASGTFCAGMDLKAFVAGGDIDTHRGLLGMTQRPPTKPMIAAVEGWALAGGCELALSCDLIVAAKGSMFGIPEVKRGIIAAAGGLARLPLSLPYHLAMELALTGEALPSERAYQLGMVNRLVDQGKTLPVALELAAMIGRNGPLAVRTSKLIMATSRGWNDQAFWDEQRTHVDAVLSSDDAREGATAFAEKREPRWTGR